MSIKCIALDLDGTTLHSGGTLSEGNRRALEYAVSRGVEVVIASGRAVSTLPQDVLSVPGIRYAVTSNGAAIYHLPSRQLMRRLHLRRDCVEKVLSIGAAEREVVMELFIDGQAYADESYVSDPTKFGAPPPSIEYVRRTRRSVKDIAAFARAHIDELESIDLIVRDITMRDRLWRQMEQEVEGVYITSSVPRLLEISDRESGKHGGVKFLCQYLGIPLARTAAFGDADNDADMLSLVGVGVAMANASPRCKAAADRITGSNDEDGVGEEIYRLLAE